MNAIKWILVALFAFEALFAILRIGKERAPITPRYAAYQVATWTIFAALVVAA